MGFEWDEIDFLDCLEVFPEVDEDNRSYFYEVTKDGMKLEVVVWSYESLILLSLSQQGMEAPLTEFVLMVRAPVVYIKHKRGDYLEFQDCIILPKASSYQPQEDLFDKTHLQTGLMIQLAIKPHIQIRLCA